MMPGMPPDLSHRAEMLLNFWFAPERASERDRSRNIWFQATAEFDAALAEHFRADYDHAAAGVYEPWRAAPQTCLALILLLDQLPRNLFRNSPRAYATDTAALEIAREAVARGYDQAEAPVRRWFFYMPFQHSESLSDQHSKRPYGSTPVCRNTQTRRQQSRQHAVIIRSSR
jgi:uncharacterized protein (DUF924 family)